MASLEIKTEPTMHHPHSDFSLEESPRKDRAAEVIEIHEENKFHVQRDDSSSPHKGAYAALPDSPVKHNLTEKSPLMAPPPPGQIVLQNFLGTAPFWYKLVIIGFLILNPFSALILGNFWTGWVLTFEFIFTLIMALHCYPLQPGGLLVIEAVCMGMVSTNGVYHNVEENLPVLLLVIFMVTGIHFMREFLMSFFTKVLLMIPNKTYLSLVFLASTALFSAWLDALTVTAVLINVCYGFYSIYHHAAVEESRGIRLGVALATPSHSPSKANGAHGEAEAVSDNSELSPEHLRTLDEFCLFLRSLLMHAVVGTAVGGTFTIVGEPQNLLIGEKVGWNFQEYFFRCCPVTISTAVVAFLTCIALEESGRFGAFFGYGYKMPTKVREILADYNAHEQRQQTYSVKAIIVVQVFVAGLLVVCLGTHVAAVGLIGLTIIVILTSFNGVIEEHKLGEAFQEAMPFTALLVVFFAIAGIIEENELFRGMITTILAMDGRAQLAWLFIITGILSSVSDNVFVATLYITEVCHSFNLGHITKAQLNLVAVTINVSTNIPSIATPNGQAAFLFLYTNRLAPLVKLTYFKMMFMALPYTITLTTISFLVCLSLESATEGLVRAGLLSSL